MTAAVAPFFPRVAKKPQVRINPNTLVVEHDYPHPDHQDPGLSKYHAQFKELHPGSCIRCTARERNPISKALHSAIKAGKYPALKGCVVRSYGKCEDGYARVWALKGKK